MTDYETERLLRMISAALKAGVNPWDLKMRIDSAISSGDIAYFLNAAASDIRNQENDTNAQ